MNADGKLNANALQARPRADAKEYLSEIEGARGLDRFTAFNGWSMKRFR